MKENREIRSVKDLLIENEGLHAQIDFLQKQISELEAEITDMKCTKRMLSSEEFGKAFARSLGVGQ